MFWVPWFQSEGAAPLLQRPCIIYITCIFFKLTNQLASADVTACCISQCLVILTGQGFPIQFSEGKQGGNKLELYMWHKSDFPRGGNQCKLTEGPNWCQKVGELMLWLPWFQGGGGHPCSYAHAIHKLGSLHGHCVLIVFFVPVKLELSAEGKTYGEGQGAYTSHIDFFEIPAGGGPLSTPLFCGRI